MRELDVGFLLVSLWAIRLDNYKPELNDIHFCGYIAACMHLGFIDTVQYMNLSVLAHNARDYRAKELSA